MSGNAYPQLHDGRTVPVDSFQKQKSGSSANQSLTSSKNAGQVVPPGEWTTVHVPAAAAQATCTKTAPGIGKRLIITGIHATIAAAATVQTPILVELLDGSTQIMAWKVACPADGMGGIALSRQCIVVTENASATLRFGAAGAASTEQAVTLCGHIAE